MLNTIYFISVHHTGGLGSNPFASTQNLTEKHINEAHKQRWPDFPSKLNGSFIGYNFVIYPDRYAQYRYIGEAGAHTIGRNLDSIGICLTGNFSKKPDGSYIDQPTKYQLEMLRFIVIAMLEHQCEAFGLKVAPETDLALSVGRLWPHRTFMPKGYTECYGTKLSDTFVRDLIIDYYNRKMNLPRQLILGYSELVKWLSKPKPVLGGNDRDCGV